MPHNWVCGDSFALEHNILSCTYDGFPMLRHNEIHDIIIKLKKQVCHNVCIEPSLQTLNGETFQNKKFITEDSTRLDIDASDFWDYIIH